jgi:hypothetical protein
LRDDVGESVNLYTEHPEIVEKLNAVATEIRRDMGDAHLGIEGENVRPIGEVSDPVPLTQYDENHPYMIAMYDLADSKVMGG